jgi:hypothetical protein
MFATGLLKDIHEAQSQRIIVAYFMFTERWNLNRKVMEEYATVDEAITERSSNWIPETKML